jgi:lysophospholipase L1-like esterase
MFSVVPGVVRGRPAAAGPVKAGLQLWAEADVPALNDGDPVTTWTDQSGLANHPLGAGGTRPTYKAAVLAGRPVLRFTAGGGSVLDIAAFAVAQPATHYIVARASAAAMLFGGGAPAGPYQQVYIETSGQLKIYAGQALLSTLVVGNQWMLIRAEFNGVTSKLFMNGLLSVGGDPFAGSLARLKIGNNGAGSYQLDGDLAAYLVYTGIHSAGQVAQTEGYLQRWFSFATQLNLSGTDLADNGYNVARSGYFECSPLARAMFTTSALRLRIDMFSNLWATWPAITMVAVRSNGALVANVGLPADGMAYAIVELPAGSGKTVEVIAGGQQKPAATLTGVFPFKVSFDGGAVLVAPVKPASRVVVYGDSISCGFGATNPPSEGWAQLLRAQIPVALEAWGYRSLHDDYAVDPTFVALAGQLASYAPSRVWLAIGTNDYGLSGGLWTAAAFGTAYGTMLDAIHAALPSATIYAQSPTIRTSEAANGLGSTLPDYRAQIVTATGARGWSTYVSGLPILVVGDLADTTHPHTAGHNKLYLSIKGTLGV